MDLSIQWPLVAFSLLAGSAGALAAFASLAELTGKALQARFAALLCALALIVVSGCASIVHLASPQNVMAAATNLFSFSGISIELIMLGLAFVVAAVYAALVKRDASPVARKVLAGATLVCGLGLAFVCGHGYVIEARPFWNTELLPIAYLGSVLPAGAFGYLLVGSILKIDVDELLALRSAVAVCAAASIASMLAYVAFVGFDVAGRNPMALYGGIAACGMAAVAVCTVLLRRRNTPGSLLALAAVGTATALVAACALRVLMWVASDAFANLFGLAASMGVLG